MNADRRPQRHVFQATATETLEPRQLLSTGQAEVSRVADLLVASRRQAATPSRAGEGAIAAAAAARAARVPIQTFIGNGGRTVRVRDSQGEYFDIKVQGVGTVTATPMPSHDGRVRIIALGTNSSSNLVVEPVRPVPRLNQAHTFNPAFGVGDELLNVGAIEIRSGRIGQILGFRTVNLSGPVVVRGESQVDRIAVNRLLPGATIDVANDLNTLDVFVNADLSGPGTGIFVGRDLNWTNVRGNLTIADGAAIRIGRDLGLVAQGAKGTAVGGQGLLVQGNLVIAPSSAFIINRNLVGPVTVQGNFTGASRFIVLGTVRASVSVLGTVTP